MYMTCGCGHKNGYQAWILYACQTSFELALALQAYTQISSIMACVLCIAGHRDWGDRSHHQSHHELIRGLLPRYKQLHHHQHQWGLAWWVGHACYNNPKIFIVQLAHCNNVCNFFVFSTIMHFANWWSKWVPVHMECDCVLLCPTLMQQAKAIANIALWQPTCKFAVATALLW